MAPTTPNGTPNGTPKTLSSKLLTMKVNDPPKSIEVSKRLSSLKFMQRAAASSNNTTPSTASSDRPAKRPRLSDGVSPATPTPLTKPFTTSAYATSFASSSPAEDAVDVAIKAAVDAALVEEKRKEQAAIDKAAAEAGEERWVLVPRELDPPVQKPTVKYVTSNYLEGSSSDSDSDDPESERNKYGFKRRPVMGRTRKFYGNPNMKITVPAFMMPEKKPAEKKRKRGDDEDDEEPSEAKLRTGVLVNTPS